MIRVEFLQGQVSYRYLQVGPNTQHYNNTVFSCLCHVTGSANLVLCAVNFVSIISSASITTIINDNVGTSLYDHNPLVFHDRTYKAPL